MSSAKRRRGKSLHLELSNGPLEEKPPIAALFLVKFDAKAGYTIAWKRSTTGLQLSESVEYKSLPSGLHNVKEDLVYFMHDDEHAGISAFVNKSDAGWERNALMLAVGALVPLSHGRMGRSWKHVEKLKELAKYLNLLQHPLQTQNLEEFWEANRLRDDRAAEQSGSPSATNLNGNGYREQIQTSPNGRAQNRGRATSTASGLMALDQRLSSHHPALSLPTLLDTFGPLVYPLYKAALLRKRILLLTEAPIELPCNFVYDISILSSIPSSVSDLLPLEPLPNRLQPLFAIGVHDIESLSRAKPKSASSNEALTDEDPNYGWIACTTDDVLGTKPNLFDILVTIPPSYTKQAKEKQWPRLKSVSKSEIKANQRDLRRYRTLRQELRRFHTKTTTTSPYPTSNTYQPTEDPINDQQAPLLPVPNTQETFDDASSTIDEKIIEPASWSSLAYSSFMWWASAGEKRADLDEESELDAALFRDLLDYSVSPNNRPRSRRASSPNLTSAAGAMTDSSTTAFPEMSIIAYFHRLTALILGTLAGIVEAWDPPTGQQEAESERVSEPVSEPGRQEEAEAGLRREDEETAEGVEEAVLVRSDDMTRMGLDSWSEGDREFVRELVELYWGRRAEVQGTRIECCGVRIAG